MTRKQQALRLVLLAALAAMAGVWLLFPPARQATVTSGDSADTSAVAEPPSPAVALVSLPPRPPRDARPADVLPLLQARADVGDGIAACRVSVELMRCQLIARKLPDTQATLEQQLKIADPRAIADIESHLEQVRAKAATCAHVPAAMSGRAQHYLRAAALAGEPLSRLRYASGAGFDDTGAYDYLLTPEFDHWRREAPSMMQQSLADGRPEAAFSLAFAHGGDQGLFAGLVANDDFQALAYSRLLHRLFGESLRALPIPLPQPALGAPDAARAEALAAQWHQRHFGGKTFDLVELMRTSDDSPWGDGRTQAESAADPCPAPDAHLHE